MKGDMINKVRKCSPCNGPSTTITKNILLIKGSLCIQSFLSIRTVTFPFLIVSHVFDSPHIASVQSFGKDVQDFYTMRFLRGDTSKKSFKMSKGDQRP